MSTKSDMPHSTAPIVNPHAAQPISPVALAETLWRNRQLIGQMTKREVLGRYQGSVLGLGWSFLSPIFMLTVYTFVFSEIFRSRWGGGGGDDSKTQFAVLIFVGIILLNLFSEVLNRAPTLIVANMNYVKKVVFPVDVLPVVAMGAALFHGLASFFVLLIGFFIFNGYLQWTVIFFGFVLIPLVFFTLGLAWILASMGVFLRDIGQAVLPATTILMFLSPVFYPITAVPIKFRTAIMINPLAFIIEQSRDVLIWGRPPDWAALFFYFIASILVAWTGYFWFQKTRKGFADVL